MKKSKLSKAHFNFCKWLSNKLNYNFYEGV